MTSNGQTRNVGNEMVIVAAVLRGSIARLREPEVESHNLQTASLTFPVPPHISSSPRPTVCPFVRMPIISSFLPVDDDPADDDKCEYFAGIFLAERPPAGFTRQSHVLPFKRIPNT